MVSKSSSLTLGRKNKESKVKRMIKTYDDLLSNIYIDKRIGQRYPILIIL